VAVARRYVPDLRVALVGQTMPHFDVSGRARALGIDGCVSLPGYVSDEDLPAYLAASDVVASLRWPSGRETSASWLRALAAGRATIVTELRQQADIPTCDPRSWTAAATGSDAPVAVGIDILDEAHSLTLALKRLAADAPLRARLGASARAWWARHHTLERMGADYVSALTEAAGWPAPPVALPAHLRPDPARLARHLAAAFPGVEIFARPGPVTEDRPDG
jgi:glycosyltransferase involved in cell wall biosynthesis